jgi:hypothetical protein
MVSYRAVVPTFVLMDINNENISTYVYQIRNDELKVSDFNSYYSCFFIFAIKKKKKKKKELLRKIYLLNACAAFLYPPGGEDRVQEVSGQRSGDRLDELDAVSANDLSRDGRVRFLGEWWEEGRGEGGEGGEAAAYDGADRGLGIHARGPELDRVREHHVHELVEADHVSSDAAVPVQLDYGRRARVSPRMGRRGDWGGRERTADALLQEAADLRVVDLPLEAGRHRNTPPFGDWMDR